MAGVSYPRRRTLRFRRNAAFVAVKPIRLGRAYTIQTGERIPAGMLRGYHLRRLHRQARIGEESDPWTLGALELWARRMGIPPIVIRDREVQAQPPPPVPEPVKVDESERSPRSHYRIEESPSGWHEIYLNDELVTKARGQEAVEAWLQENAREG